MCYLEFRFNLLRVKLNKEIKVQECNPNKNRDRLPMKLNSNTETRLINKN